MSMTPEQIAAAWALVNAATIGRPVQYHPNYCPEAKGAHCREWDTSHDLSVIRADGSRYRIGTFRHAHDAMFDQAARTLIPQLLTELEAERAKVARLVEGVRSVRALADHCVHGEPDCSVDDIHSELSNLLTSIKETPHE